MRSTLPRDLYHGKDALEALKTLTGKKTTVVAGSGSMKRFGFLGKVVDYPEEAGVEVKLFEGAEPDSSVDTVLKGAAAMQGFEPDWIVAVDGGSPIDVAKAMRTFCEYPDTPFEDLVTSFSFPILRTKARFCAISSTSGIATKVTAFSVTIDHKEGIKYPLANFNIVLDVAIMDSTLAEAVPGKLAAHTGVDVMTHTIGIYVLAPHCEYTDPLALHAIEIINEYLIPPYNGDMEARDKMYDAQCLAGTVFFNVLLGIIHSMAHRTGATYPGGHIVHGCTNAMCLPKVIKFNSKEPEAAARYTKIAKFISLPGITEEGLTDTLVTRLLKMSKMLDIPACIKDYKGGITDEKEFVDKLPKVAELAADDTCTGSNPRSITPRVMEQLLKCCCYDGEADL